jgi:hypothetical protein
VFVSINLDRFKNFASVYVAIDKCAGYIVLDSTDHGKNCVYFSLNFLQLILLVLF